MREIVTSCFEIAGLVLLALAAGLEAARLLDPAAGLAVSGVLLLVFSAVIVARDRPRNRERATNA